MSFDTTLFGKNASLFKKTTTKGPHALGTRWVLPDGRVFRYAKSSAAIAIGRVCGAIAHIATWDSDVVLAEARTTAQWDAGDHTIRIKSTGSTNTTLNLAANQYAGGYIWVNHEAGQGQLLQIESHGGDGSVTGSTGGIDIICCDEDILGVALTAASQVGLFRNIYDGVVTHVGAVGAGLAVGVAPLAVSSGEYFWIQTWGPCPVLVGTTLALLGEGVGVLNTTGGSTEFTEVAGTAYQLSSTFNFEKPGASISAPKVGYTLQLATAATEQSLVFLTIAP